jgi:hypothetical protein
MDRVPFDPEGILGYAGRHFDYAIENPEVYGLVSWAGPERPNAVAEFEADEWSARVGRAHYGPLLCATSERLASVRETPELDETELSAGGRSAPAPLPRSSRSSTPRLRCCSSPRA